MTIRVLKPGLSTTVQDAGRYGYTHLGISPCGAADMLSMRVANLLVGNDEYALPLTDVLSRVFKGSGECAEQAWVFLGLAIPSWTFVFFVAMIAAAIALVDRD